MDRKTAPSPSCSSTTSRSRSAGRRGSSPGRRSTSRSPSTPARCRSSQASTSGGSRSTGGRTRTGASRSRCGSRRNRASRRPSRAACRVGASTRLCDTSASGAPHAPRARACAPRRVGGLRAGGDVDAARGARRVAARGRNRRDRAEPGTPRPRAPRRGRRRDPHGRERPIGAPGARHDGEPARGRARRRAPAPRR